MGFKGSKVQTFSSRPTGKSGTYVKTRVPFFVFSAPVVHPSTPRNGAVQFPERPPALPRQRPFSSAGVPFPSGDQGTVIFPPSQVSPGRGRRRSPSPAAQLPQRYSGVSLSGPGWASQGHVFITGRPPEGVSFRSGGNFFRLTVRLGFAACVELGMLFLLHPIQNGLLLKIPYAGRNLQPVCSVRLHRLCRPAVFLWHT